jgi:uncharacterized protein
VPRAAPIYPGPTAPDERLQALDVARGCAVLGVLLMNIWAFAGPQAFFDYPLAIAGRAGAPVATWAVMHTLFEGSQRTLLSMLFGAGALLVIGRFEKPGDTGSARGIYYRRSFGLIVLGLVNAYVFMWPADILFAYGLASLCLYPLRRLGARALLLVALAALTVPLAMHGFESRRLSALESAETNAAAAAARGETLSERQRQATADWQAALKEARPSAADEDVSRAIRTMQSGTFGEIWRRQAGVSLILETVVLVKAWFLDALAMMIVGMALCRMGLLGGSGASRDRFGAGAPPTRYLSFAAGAFAVGLPLALWQTRALLATDFHPVQVEIVKMSYDLRRLAMGLGWLFLILSFSQAAGAQAIKARLAATGRMALTNYLAQSVLCAFIFYGFGLGLYGRVTGYTLYVFVAAIWLLELAWSGWWLKHFRLGPFEWLWRSFIYRRAQPWRGSVRSAVA